MSWSEREKRAVVAEDGSCSTRRGEGGRPRAKMRAEKEREREGRRESKCGMLQIEPLPTTYATKLTRTRSERILENSYRPLRPCEGLSRVTGSRQKRITRARRVRRLPRGKSTDVYRVEKKKKNIYITENAHRASCYERGVAN